MAERSRYASFRAQLIAAGHLTPLDGLGLYAFNDEFQMLIDRLDAYLQGRDPVPGRLSLRLPPVCSTSAFLPTGYLSTFPHLAGAVFGFDRGDRDHAALREQITAGDWADALTPAGLMLVSAACQPAYPLFRGTLPAAGRHATLLGQCFRREPSADPFRMQTFRQREFLRLGTDTDVTAFRDQWIDEVLEALRRLGLPVSAAAAADPFFGRAGRLMAAHQRDAEAKIEIVADLYDDARGTALASINLHGEHFGKAFGIVAGDGKPAHTSCVGFGLERLALAMLHVHGVDVGTWPEPIREVIA
jgi:seryl-tRNA synthetase